MADDGGEEEEDALLFLFCDLFSFINSRIVSFISLNCDDCDDDLELSSLFDLLNV